MKDERNVGALFSDIGAPAELWEPLMAAMRGESRSALPDSLAAEVDAFFGIGGVWEPAAVTGRDGVVLDGGFWRHLLPLPRPLVVIPSAWGAPWQLFSVLAFRLSVQGYNVLAYSPRGFFNSGGYLDVGGPRDWDDGSSVIDYVAERTGYEATAVGFLGDSYGSGISALVAAHDERVGAVAALSAWGNLATCLYENDTRHIRAFQALIGATKNEAGESVGRFDADTQQLLDGYLVHRDMDRVVAWGEVRSPGRYVGEINSRRIPMYFSSHWHETLFPPNQLLETFRRLTGPKRLVMSIGDHSAAELTGLAGLPNRVVDGAYKWLAHYLKGDDNGADADLEVSNQIMFTYTTVPNPFPVPGLPTGPNIVIAPARVEERKSWDDVSGRAERLYLKPASRPEFLTPNDGELAPNGTGTGAWERTFTAGVDAGLTAAQDPIKTGSEEVTGNPAVYETRWFDRDYAAVWKTGAQPYALNVRGIPHVHLTVTPSAASVTLIAYLFDVDPIVGRGRVITHAPTTLLAATPNQPVTVDLDLQATAYELPVGHRLMLVVATKDQLYADASLDRTSLTISSTAEDPSVLTLPMSDD